MSDNAWNEELESLVSSLIDGRLSEAEAGRLNDMLSGSSEALSRYHELLDNHEALCAIYPGDVYEASLGAAELPHEPVERAGADLRNSFSFSRRWAVAAAFLIAVGLAGYMLGDAKLFVSDSPPLASDVTVPDEDEGERTIAGHATLRRSVDIVWSNELASYREGDVLPAGVIEFDDGIAEIDLFCGATLMVEGPAKMELESDWSVRFLSGRLRANVPPAARGFVVKAAGSEIIDLGTEFALEVGSEQARVEVLDGEVKLLGGEHDGNHLLTGQGRWLRGSEGNPDGDSIAELTTVDDVRRLSEDAARRRFEAWKEASLELRKDDRLLAYYPIADSLAERQVRNAASSGSPLDGTLIGPVGRGEGRFGRLSNGLSFDRPGARVRTRIDGDFEAFTFACWVRIDNLDQRYNALFMSDSYENGEAHWQIRDDGALMFSVMVDDTQDVEHFNEIDQRVVKGAGLHRVYYSEPIWDISKRGDWFHIAAVYDPIGRRVEQYVNGELVATEVIEDKYHIDTLRIGRAEIGNWGQPFRKSPWFAVRNLNGTIDELAIFDAALSSEEIQDFYEQGKPIGY